jgi:hypothetical protein
MSLIEDWISWDRERSMVEGCLPWSEVRKRFESNVDEMF